MYFGFQLLNTLVSRGYAASLLDDELQALAQNEKDHQVILLNKTQKGSIEYSLLLESQILSSQITDIETKHKEYLIQNSKSLEKDKSLVGMEFTESHRIKTMIMPDSFDILMFREIIRMRYAYIRFNEKIYITDMMKLSDLLYFYNYLDFRANIKYTKPDQQTLRRTNVTVEANTVFAMNLVFSLASYGLLDHYQKLLTANDNIDQKTGELISLKEDLDLNVTLCNIDRGIIELFNNMPEVKAAIILASTKKQKYPMFRHPDFKLIRHTEINGKVCTVIKEEPNNDEIYLTTMPGFLEQPEVLVIMLPVHNVTEYFKFIRNFLRLTDSIETIEIIFHDSKRIKKNKFRTDADINTQVFIGWVVKYILAQEIVEKRQKVRNFGIYGYDTIDSRTLDALAKIPLNGLSLLGADSLLDYFYTFKLFNSECRLKSNIQEYAGTYGAAILLNQLVPEKQLKVLRVSRHLQFKKTNIDMIKEDPCYERLSAYFENRDLLALPMACANKDATKKIEVLKLFVFPPVPKFYSPADYNTSEKARAEIAKEITVSEEDIQQMITECKPADFNLIDIEIEENNTNKAILTLMNYDKNTIKGVLQEVDLIKNKDVLVIVCLRPLSFKWYRTHSQEKKDLVDLIIELYWKWLVKDKSDKHRLVIKVADARTTKEIENCIVSLREIFEWRLRKDYFCTYLKENKTKISFFTIGNE
ncbi:hypothetical protein ENBRE01_1780 [Enteropsectra breve]|nr:hypothetical protein ENBRE01_1780 [Enteropsectra breve]